MFENPRRGRQARNFTTNVSKILTRSQIVFRTDIFRKLTLGAPEGWTRIETMLAQLFEVFFNAMPAKITQKIVMGNAACWDLLDIFVISVTQKNICDLTLSLPECLMEFCKVNVTFEFADKILCCGHSNESSLPLLSRNAISFSKFHKKKIWKFGRNLLLAKFSSKQIIDQKQQHASLWYSPF